LSAAVARKEVFTGKGGAGSYSFVHGITSDKYPAQRRAVRDCEINF
jgi:hypothetical protein